MSQELWYFDTEVFAHDWLFVAKHQSDGEVFSVWNDCEQVQDFIRLMRPVLCGYNAAHYDSYIIKGILLDWSPEEIKVVSDTIVEQDDRSLVWALFQGYPWVNLPPIIDLWPDITPRKGLKELEAMIGMSVVESSVSFDIDRPLTDEERIEVEGYCLHDTEAVERLYDLRFNYLKSKTKLCEMRGVDPLTMLKHTNARVVSEVLGAEKLQHPWSEDDRYEVPDNIDRTAIHQRVLDYVESVNGINCEVPGDAIEFMFHGCPTVVGMGGIHAAVPSYAETATDERVILIQDIGSYYPSLIINNGYMSRAVPDASVYEQFYRMRMDAKAKGDKETADAAKLVLNTTFGVMKDAYNKMYDPMMNTRVCLSGQLYILDLIEQMFRAVPEGLQLIQLNTDGWVISCPRHARSEIDTVVSEWQERTGFTVDTAEVEKIVQANVNNYVMRTIDGKVKTKGGVVACYAGADLFYQMPQIIRNNCTIIDKAVVDYLLDGVPVEKTIADCDDIERFQIIAKAGRTFQKVIHVDGEWDEQTDMPYDIEVQRVNRVYATNLEQYGGIFKVKLDENGEETGRQRVPLTPEHCFVDNENLWQSGQNPLTMLDKTWYVTLAKRKAREFITRDKKEREQMATESEEHNELHKDTAAEEPKTTPRRKSSKQDAKAETEVTEKAVAPFGERLLRLQEIMAGASTGVTFDGVVSNINYEYADTQQYKMFLSKACTTCGLVFMLNMECEFLGEIGKTNNGGSLYAAQADGEVVIGDAYSEAAVTYLVSGFGSNVQAGYCNGGAQTNALRNFILNNFLLDNKGREGDDQAFNAATESVGGTPKFVSGEQKDAMKNDIADKKAKEAQHPTKLFVDALAKKLTEAHAIDSSFPPKALKEHFSKKDGAFTAKLHTDGPHKGKPTILKSDAVDYLNAAEEIIAGAGEAA